MMEMAVYERLLAVSPVFYTFFMADTGKRASTFVVGSLAIALVSSIAMAGIRPPGKYNGVVFYDRWDNCYVFSGVYLMYVSEKVKGILRPYQGRSIEIDAKKVYQPINPGDGLITSLAVVGDSKENPQTPRVSGIQIRAAVFTDGGGPRATVEIRNTSLSTITIDADALGFAVLGHHRYPWDCPSDGTSCAVITRASAASSDGKNRLGDATWAWHVISSDRLPTGFTLSAGQARATSLNLQLMPGSYQFVAGYGGGVHSGPCVASNAVSFDVPRN